MMAIGATSQFYEEAGDTLTRLTFGENNSYPFGRLTVRGSLIPLKTKKDRRILVDTRRRFRGGAASQPRQDLQHARSWRPDGKVLALRQLNFSATVTAWDVMTLSIDGDEKSGWKPEEPQPFVNSPSFDMEPAFSADGRWLAYSSNESGGAFRSLRSAFPRPGWQVANLQRWRKTIPSGR
jgi:hypothetical protein